MTVGDMKRTWQQRVAVQEIVLGNHWLMEISSQHNRLPGITGSIILAPFRPCQVTATYLKIRYP